MTKRSVKKLTDKELKRARVNNDKVYWAVLGQHQKTLARLDKEFTILVAEITRRDVVNG